MKQNLVNSNSAVVTRLLDGGQRVELRLPKGGRAQAQNRGFEVGEVVCFTLDATGKRIISILPKEVADLKVAIAQDPMLQSALQEYDDDTIEDDCTGFGQEAEGDPYSSRGVHREGVEIWGDHEYDPLDYEDSDGLDYLCDADTDASGEAPPDEVLVFAEHGGIPELVEDDDPFA
jgi:hypothetical protein